MAVIINNSLRSHQAVVINKNDKIACSEIAVRYGSQLPNGPFAQPRYLALPKQ